MTVWENNIENNHCQLNLMEQQQFFRSITTESRLFKQALFQDVEKKKKKTDPQLTENIHCCSSSM